MKLKNFTALQRINSRSSLQD